MSEVLHPCEWCGRWTRHEHVTVSRREREAIERELKAIADEVWAEFDREERARRRKR